VKIARKIECCGSSLQGKSISIAALFTLSFPLVLILTPVALALQLMSIGLPFLRGLSEFLRTVLKANLTLIREADVAPMMKCQMSGALIRRSPLLAGWAFKNFNLTVFVVIFLVGVSMMMAVAWAVDQWI
jgi:hypothetical protein